MHGNQTIIPGTQDLTLGQFYETHKRSGSAEVYFSKLPKAAACLKGRVLALELWIDTVSVSPGFRIFSYDSLSHFHQYELRTGQQVNSIVNSRKRKTSTTGMIDLSVTKRPRGILFLNEL